MRLLTTLSDCSWITTGVAELIPGTNSTVAHCIPPIFTSYTKILHPICEDLLVQDKELTWQEEDKAKTPMPAPETETERTLADILSRATLVYGGSHSGSRLVRIRWAELAGRLGLSVGPTISAQSFTRQFPGRSWPRHLIGPQEGSIEGPERDALASVLCRHTDADRTFFRFWFLATTDLENDKLFEGLLDEVSLFPDEALGVRCTPTHWFPEDRSWLVCSDYDLTFTLVGGSASLAQELLDHPVLECVPVRPETRVDWQADLEEAAH